MQLWTNSPHLRRSFANLLFYCAEHRQIVSQAGVRQPVSVAIGACRIVVLTL